MDPIRNTTTGIEIGEQMVNEGLFSGLVVLSEMRQLLDELYGSLEDSPWEDVNRSDEQAPPPPPTSSPETPTPPSPAGTLVTAWDEGC
jgi:hypothetical protein